MKGIEYPQQDFSLHVPNVKIYDPEEERPDPPKEPARGGFIGFAESAGYLIGAVLVLSALIASVGVLALAVTFELLYRPADFPSLQERIENGDCEE